MKKETINDIMKQFDKDEELEYALKMKKLWKKRVISTILPLGILILLVIKELF